MKILQLCKKFPYPLNDGESVAVTSLAKSLQQLGCEVTLLAMNTSKHYVNINDLPKSFNHYKAIHTVDVDNQVKPFEALKALVKGENYFLTRFESAEYEAKLKALLEKEDFDIIQFETVQILIYAKREIFKHSRAKIVLRSHNVEHEIWERIVNNSKISFKKWYLNRLTKQLKQFEIEQFEVIDALVSITQRDLDLFRNLGFKGKGQVTPIGLSANNYLPNYQSFDNKPNLSFIGTLDWFPNIEGVNWFLEKVMPKTENIILHIAGRNAPESLLNLQMQNVTVHGEVKDSANFINNHSIMIVPLFSGSGMRVKILEGMALGRVIITTSLGLEGIAAVDEQHIFIANTATEFTDRIEFIKNNPTILKAIGENAKAFIESEFDNLTIAKRLMDYYSELVE
jgi:glycosyltransferase involved in cell wall biosynthesis